MTFDEHIDAFNQDYKPLDVIPKGKGLRIIKDGCLGRYVQENSLKSLNNLRHQIIMSKVEPDESGEAVFGDLESTTSNKVAIQINIELDLDPKDSKRLKELSEVDEEHRKRRLRDTRSKIHSTRMEIARLNAEVENLTKRLLKYEG